MKTDLHAAGLIAAHVARGFVRQRLLAAVGVAIGVFGWLVWELRAFHFGGGEVRFVADLSVAALSLGGMALALGLTLAQVGGENGRRSIMALLPKAVSLRAYILGQWMGVMMGVAMFIALMLVAAGVLMRMVEEPGVGVPWVILVQVSLLQGAKCGVVASAVILLCGLVRSGALAGWLGVLLVAAGQLRGTLATLPARVQLAGVAVTRVIEFLVPDLALFDQGEALGAGLRIGWDDTVWLTTYACLYVAGFLVLAVQVLRRREI
ncbi:hypothetical protein MASR2M8_07940 [Opitutaceae bacterium]